MVLKAGVWETDRLVTELEAGALETDRLVTELEAGALETDRLENHRLSTELKAGALENDRPSTVLETSASTVHASASRQAAGAGFRPLGRRARAERGVQRADAGSRSFVPHECDTLVALWFVWSLHRHVSNEFLMHCTTMRVHIIHIHRIHLHVPCMVCMMHVMLRIRRIRWVKGPHEDVVSVYLGEQRH